MMRAHTVGEWVWRTNAADHYTLTAKDKNGDA